DLGEITGACCDSTLKTHWASNTSSPVGNCVHATPRDEIELPAAFPLFPVALMDYFYRCSLLASRTLGVVAARRLLRAIPAMIKLKMTAANSSNQPQYWPGW